MAARRPRRTPARPRPPRRPATTVAVRAPHAPRAPRGGVGRAARRQLRPAMVRTARLTGRLFRWGRGRWRRVDAEHRRDLGGVLLLIAAVVAAATVWVRTGRALHAAGNGLYAAAGVPTWLLPAALGVAGLLVITQPPRPGNRLLGWVCTAAGGLGVLHLANPHRRWGGWAGWVTGGLPDRVMPTALTVLVLLLLGGFGVLVLCRTPARQAPAAARTRLGRRTGGEEEVLEGEIVDPDGDGDDEDDDEADGDVPDEAPRPARVPHPRRATTPTAPAAAKTPTPVVPRPVPGQAPTHSPAPNPTQLRQLALTDTLFTLPPGDLLSAGQPARVRGRDTDRVVDAINAVLDQHRVAGRVVDHTRGPTVTRYEVSLDPGVKVAAFTRLSKNLAMAVKATHGVRIVAPIPGRDRVGVEVPNEHRDTVLLGDVLRSRAALGNPAPLLVGLGADVEGQHVVGDIARWPHAIIAGTTGGGKSCLINSGLVSVLTRSTPDEVRMLLIDPKGTELAAYAGLPHLAHPIVTGPEDGADALAWAMGEMERRNARLATAGCRDIDRYNTKVRAGAIPGPLMPRLLVVVDELADLLMVDKERRTTAAARPRVSDLIPAEVGEEPPSVEYSTQRLTQLGRACGLHCLLATQHPTAKVLTGLIKANTPVRLALSVSSMSASQTILGEGRTAAVHLLGQGDCLYLGPGQPAEIRLQAALTPDDDIDHVVTFWRDQATRLRAAAA
jgi:DNA segregation ATPase FtsK/SpoIIIE, S-DNA-T family